MLEFCETVKPTLEDYETDGVSSTTFLTVSRNMVLTRLFCLLGMAHTPGQFRAVEEKPCWQWQC